MVEPTHLKNMLVKMGSSSPKFGLKIKKWNHQIVNGLALNFFHFFKSSWRFTSFWKNLMPRIKSNANWKTRLLIYHPRKWKKKHHPPQIDKSKAHNPLAPYWDVRLEVIVTIVIVSWFFSLFYVHLWCKKPMVNKGIADYETQLFTKPDFWSIKRINDLRT